MTSKMRGISKHKTADLLELGAEPKARIFAVAEGEVQPLRDGQGGPAGGGMAKEGWPGRDGRGGMARDG